MNTAKIDLHLHLDGSLNIRWAYERSLLRNTIDKDMSFEDFYNILFAHNKHHSAENFKKFEIVCDVMQEYEDLFDSTYDLCRRLNDIGLIYAELRFASQQHCKRGLSQSDAIKAVIDGANKAMEDFDIRVGIINSLMHKADSALVNEKENLETILASEKFLGKGLVGLDLAGFENNCDYREYAPMFKLAKEKGIPFTLHAGEMGNGENILFALDMEPDRIGHGVDCIQDERYIQALLERNMPLEVCVSSNIKMTRNYAEHPIRYMMDRGLKVTVNTDNMIFSRSDLFNEHQQLKMIGVSDERLMQSTYDSLDAAFCDEETKKILKKKLDEEFR